MMTFGLTVGAILGLWSVLIAGILFVTARRLHGTGRPLAFAALCVLGLVQASGGVYLFVRAVERLFA